MKFKFMPTEDLTESRSNLTLLHSKQILKIFSRIYLQFQGFRVWKPNETKRFKDFNECQSDCRETFYGSLNIKVLYVLFLAFMLRHKILKSKFNRPAKLLISLGVR